MTGMRWTYPQDELLALARQRVEAEAARPVSVGVEIAQLNFDYRVTGDKPAWRPLRAFDDGRQTWIEFPAAISTGEAPPLFVLGDKGEAELINYRISGRSEEHTSELQSLMRISYAVFCLKKKKRKHT